MEGLYTRQNDIELTLYPSVTLEPHLPDL